MVPFEKKVDSPGRVTLINIKNPYLLKPAEKFTKQLARFRFSTKLAV